jgi:thiol-disulfide isomerase/thioredoxin
MKESVVLRDSTFDLGSVTSLPRAMSHWRTIVWKAFPRFSCAGLLLVAAILKASQLSKDPGSFFFAGSRWVQVLLIAYELLLVIWLLSGVCLCWSRRIAIVTFIGFSCSAFFSAISRQASCGCFGQVQLNPWITFSIDAVVCFFLFAWNPHRVSGESTIGQASFPVSSPASRIISVSLVIFSVSVISIAMWSPAVDSSVHGSLPTSDVVLLAPEKWIGQPLPILDSIDMTQPSSLLQDSWILVFYHYDCPKCQEALIRYERLAERFRMVNDNINIAFIELPPFATSSPIPAHFCRLGHLRLRTEGLIMMPSEVRMVNGRVASATSELGQAVSDHEPFR